MLQSEASTEAVFSVNGELPPVSGPALCVHHQTIQ